MFSDYIDEDDEVVRMRKDGYSIRMIAATLGIPEGYVRTYLYGRYGVFR